MNLQSLLFPWQFTLVKDVVYGLNKYGILEKSRRIGGTFAFSIASVLYCELHNEDAWFSSMEEETGKLFIKDVRRFCEIYNIAFGYERIKISSGNTSQIQMPNGRTITSVTSNPDNLRGKEGLMILDEFAIHEDQASLYSTVQPSIAGKGKLWIISTHKGVATEFYRYAKEAERGKKNWSHYKVTVVDAVAQGYVERRRPELTREAFIQELKDNALSEEHYQQEFMAEPISLTALVKPEQYDKLRVDNLKLNEITGTLDYSHVYFPLICGLDVGRTIDKTVFWALEQRPNPKAKADWDQFDYFTVCIKAIHNTDIPTQVQILRPLIAHQSVSIVLIDIGTVGRTLADAFIDEFPNKCQPFSFTAPNKGALAERLKGFIEHEKITLPHDDDIREQFLAVRREPTPSGNIKYEGRTRTSHCDAFWSCAMALEAASQQQTGMTVIGMG